MLIQIFTLIFTGIFVGISQSAGIGGGAIVNVLLIVGLGYNAKDSIAITYIFLMGGGLASSLVSATKKTQNGKRLLDYDLILITLPMMMSGAIYGTIINHFISELIVSILLAILIAYVFYTTYNKLKQSKSEVVRQPLLESSIELVKMKDMRYEEKSYHEVTRLQEIKKEQQALIPIDKIKILLHVYVYTFALLILRGGKSFDSLIGIDRCGFGGWACAILHLFLSYMYCKSIAMKRCNLDKEMENLGYVFEDQKQKMTESKMRQALFNGFFAGVLGGCVSIGGGMVLVPLWLKEGLDKNIATSSTGPLIFFSSSISFFISCILGKYNSVLQVLLFFSIAFAGSYFIKIILIQKYKFRQLVFQLLLGMMFISFVTLIPSEYQKYKLNPIDFMKFDKLC